MALCARPRQPHDRTDVRPTACTHKAAVLARCGGRDADACAATRATKEIEIVRLYFLSRRRRRRQLRPRDTTRASSTIQRPSTCAAAPSTGAGAARGRRRRRTQHAQGQTRGSARADAHGVHTSQRTALRALRDDTQLVARVRSVHGAAYAVTRPAQRVQDCGARSQPALR